MVFVVVIVIVFVVVIVLIIIIISPLLEKDYMTGPCLDIPKEMCNRLHTQTRTQTNKHAYIITYRKKRQKGRMSEITIMEPTLPTCVVLLVAPFDTFSSYPSLFMKQH